MSDIPIQNERNTDRMGDFRHPMHGILIRKREFRIRKSRIRTRNSEIHIRKREIPIQKSGFRDQKR